MNIWEESVTITNGRVVLESLQDYIDQDNLEIVQDYGLTVDEAVKMGLLTPTA
jgi:hypothetical protein